MFGFFFKLWLSWRFLALRTPTSLATPLETSLVAVLCSCAPQFSRQYVEHFDVIFAFRGRSGSCNAQTIRINRNSAGCFSFRSPTLPPNFFLNDFSCFLRSYSAGTCLKSRLADRSAPQFSWFSAVTQSVSHSGLLR